MVVLVVVSSVARKWDKNKGTAHAPKGVPARQMGNAPEPALAVARQGEQDLPR